MRALPIRNILIKIFFILLSFMNFAFAEVNCKSDESKVYSSNKDNPGAWCEKTISKMVRWKSIIKEPGILEFVAILKMA
jgi:hypothetical protein